MTTPSPPPLPPAPHALDASPPLFTCSVRPAFAAALGSFAYWSLAMVAATVLITMVIVSGVLGAANHTTLLAIIIVGALMAGLQPFRLPRVFGRRANLELQPTPARARLTVHFLTAKGRTEHTECFENLQQVRCERRDLSGDRFELRLAAVQPDGKTVGLFTTHDRRFRYFAWTEAQLREVAAAVNAASAAKENAASAPLPVD
ncbi:MAG: hypothetical protein ACREJ2_10295 [Planctomycetota bacterium]